MAKLINSVAEVINEKIRSCTGGCKSICTTESYYFFSLFCF
jgi:hypothetical protein